MLEWAGWRLDQGARRLVAPIAADLTAVEAAGLAALIEARGGVLSRRTIGEALAGITKSVDPATMAGAVAHLVNKRLRGRVGARVANVRRFGYRLLPATQGAVPEEIARAEEAERRRIAVEAILVEELEATGPHARAVAKLIEEVYERGDRLK
jgi:DNA-binding winged helix-turn-helix (wHTH) protein